MPKSGMLFSRKYFAKDSFWRVPKTSIRMGRPYTRWMTAEGTLPGRKPLICAFLLYSLIFFCYPGLVVRSLYLNSKRS